MKKRDTSTDLTPREWQVIELLSKGMRAKEAAEALGISEFTARTHIRNAYEKTDSRSVANVLYKVLTTKEATAVDSFCKVNECEVIQWLDPSKIADFGQAERCILQYETAILEATHIGNGIFIGNGQIMPKPMKVARYPKGFKSTLKTVQES